MKHSHLLWKLFGVGFSDWDDLPYDDFLWMRASAEDYARKQGEAK